MGSSTTPGPDETRSSGRFLDGPVVIKAWAPWCGSCRALTPVVDSVADTTGVQVVDLRVDSDPDLVEHFGVRSVPTLLALRNGAEVGRLVGLQPVDAVQSLFAVAAGTSEHVRRRAPTSLIAARALAGAVVTIAGLVLGSVALSMLGALGIGWAGFGLIRR